MLQPESPAALHEVPRPKYRWYHKTAGLIAVILLFEIGIFLVVWPWASEWDAVFPQYGLVRHKGYSTDEHMAALRQYGPTLLHRFSFEPVRLACSFPIWAGYDEKGDDLVEHATA